MKYLLFVIVIFVFVFQFCQKNSENKDNNEITKIFEQYYEDRLKLYPIEATRSGDNRYNDLLPNNITREYRSSLNNFYSSYRKKLLNFKKDELSGKDQLSYDVLKWECDVNLEELNYQTHLTPINQMWSLQFTIGQFAGGTSAQPFTTVADYQSWLKRLDAFTVWCDTAIANMRTGIKKGYVLPKSLAKKVIMQMAQLDHGSIEEHLFYSPVKLIPGTFSKRETDQIQKEYSNIIRTKIIPSFKRVHDFMKEEYLPVCRETAGINAIPSGNSYYNHQIKKYTTTDMTADEIFILGQNEVERIQKEMIAVKNQVGYKGEIKDFFDFVRGNRELMPFTKAEQVIERFNMIHNTMKPNLARLFDRVPKTSFEIRRTELFREKSASAQYNPGSLDGIRPGIFYCPIPNVEKYNIFVDESLFLHEAIPGHHYQISLQQENADLPMFRRTLWYSSYGEGWALYAEALGEELGLYTDPYQYFGMLSAEIHRAIRLVVDTGMHAKGWTREQAIQYSLDNEAQPEHKIVSEIERYMANPGQALSYKIGQLKIRHLRAKAEQSLGEQFDIREFHNQVLESGCIPLNIFEAKIDKWIGS